MAQSGSSRRALLGIAGAALALGLLAWWLRFEPAPPRPSAPPPGPSTPAPDGGAVRPEPAPLPLVSAGEGPIRLGSGQVVAVTWEDLVAADAPSVELVLPEGVRAKSGRILTPTAEAIAFPEIAGRGGAVAFALPVERMVGRGRFVIEVHTDERSAVPLRRCAVEVR